MNARTQTPRRGRIIGGLPHSLDRHDPVSIGSDRGCTIVVEGADPHHAELRWDTGEEAWFLHDDPAPSDIYVNGEAVESCRLHEGDWFDVAGAKIRYANGILSELDADGTVGLRVTVRHVSAVAGGARRLDDISFQVGEGRFVALLGPSGCGKSTLIQRIAGLAPFDGEILFNGHDTRKETESLFPLVAYLPQAVEDTLHADMTVREAMKDFARCHLASDVRPDFAAKLGDVDLDWNRVATTPIRQLSGGMKRRLALALALLRDPQLLLLDEPTAGLDPASEASIMELLRRLSDQGRTIMCATHVLSSLNQCDDVVVLAPGGRLVFSGRPDEALSYFAANDWLTIYRALEEGDWTAAAPAAADDPVPRKLPAPPAAASFASAFFATLGRLVHSVCSSRNNALLFFCNPVGVAIVLSFACGRMFGDGGDKNTVCFCMAVAMFWLGLSGSVRNLVAERVPMRCLNRMRGIPIARYFAAHVAFVALAAVMQSLLFVFPVFLLRHHAIQFSQGAMPAFLGVLALIGFAGGCVGLAVSAGAKKDIQAVWALPFVAILALFLSKPVLESKDEDKPSGLLRAVECAMPTLYTQECLYAELGRFRVSNPDLAEISRTRMNFTLLGICYPLLFLPLAFWLQNRREKEWDGR